MNPAPPTLSSPEAAAPDATTPTPHAPHPLATAKGHSPDDNPGEAEYASWMRLIRFPFGLYA